MCVIEKVIKALECCAKKVCIYKDTEKKCPYWELSGEYEDSFEDCTTALSKDALALLKAQEPRVLTREEAQAINAPGTLVWLEVSGGYEGSRYRALPSIISDNTVGLSDAMYFYNTAARAWSAYNREVCGWRLWTAEPTDEQRHEVKWE